MKKLFKSELLPNLNLLYDGIGSNLTKDKPQIAIPLFVLTKTFFPTIIFPILVQKRICSKLVRIKLKFLTLIFIFFNCANAQWIVQQAPTTNRLYDVTFPDSSEGGNRIQWNCSSNGFRRYSAANTHKLLYI